MQNQGGGDVPLSQQVAHDSSGLGKFDMTDAAGYHQQQQLAEAMAAAAAAAQQQQDQKPAIQQRSPAPMYPGPSTIPVNFSSGQINSAEALQQFQTNFWKAHIASIEDNVPDFKTHLLPLARIKKVMKSDPDVKVQMISAEAPILFSKACEVFITEITQRAWMNAEENKRRTLQRQDVSFAAQRSEMFDFLIDVVPREEFAAKKASGGGSTQKDETVAAQPAGVVTPQQQQSVQPQTPQQQPQQVQQQTPSQPQQQPPQQQQQQQQSQTSALYNDPAFHQYYAQHLAEAAGFSQAAGTTPEQRQAYYQQIEREQLQWLQRQTNLGVGQQQSQPSMGVQFGDGSHQQQHADGTQMRDDDHGN
ncbi:hypothetical protein EV178_006021 [Coemansia sp. RSA 1646]|nr:hypothetical protein EV178_006021 [Coemansia sp. RSA 1646]KAJ2210754.1 hypothetical protein EV179_006014 [Coemansia sp. RSA 487]